ncbi:MAG: hypothetical protein WBL07_11310, partial [Thiothrix litoralis]|uniref:hypothetical protein n=1 Tax=Thiothrix litoralis TaxID=2891210 RepID=UPI003C771C60
DTPMLLVAFIVSYSFDFRGWQKLPGVSIVQTGTTRLFGIASFCNPRTPGINRVCASYRRKKTALRVGGVAAVCGIESRNFAVCCPVARTADKS